MEPRGLPCNHSDARAALETIDMPARSHTDEQPAADTTRREPRLGDTLAGTYRLQSVLGAGGMGVVYAAIHVRTGKEVALKLLRTDTESSTRQRRERAERFQREARAAGRIRHPNVIDIYDVGSDLDAPYLVMPKLQGETLRQRLQRGRLTFSECMSLTGPAIRGLAEAHRRGVIHRDLKPDNIFLANASDGTEIVPILLDFGVCRLLRTEPSAPEITTLTRYGTFLGTPSYMPLEQLRGDRDVDARSDVFALGVVLYEALTGRLPFLAVNDRALAVKLATEEPEPLHQLVPEIDPRISAIVQRALAREPKRRYAHAGKLLEALETWSASDLTRKDGKVPLVWLGGLLTLLGLGLFMTQCARVQSPRLAKSDTNLQRDRLALGSATDSKIAHPTQGSPVDARGVTQAGSGLKRITPVRHAELARHLTEIREQEALLASRRAFAREHSPAPSAHVPAQQTWNTSVVRPADKAYIQSRIQEIVPLLAECYEREIVDSARRAGDLKLRFTIEGDPSVGGIVGDMEVLSGSLEKHRDFVTCVKETMYTLQFAAPDERGFVVVEYPFSFASD